MVEDREDFADVTEIQGLYEGEKVTVALDANGRIISIMKGDFEGTPKDVAVTEAGNIITVLKGATGYDVYVDHNGHLSCRMKGDYEGYPKDITVDGDGNIVSVMKGIFGDELKIIAVDSESRMLARSLAAVESSLILNPSASAGSSGVYLDMGTVPAGKMWYITNITVYNQTHTVDHIRLLVQKGATEYYFRREMDVPAYTSVEYNGQLWMDEGETLKALFLGCTVNDALKGFVLGGVITK